VVKAPQLAREFFIFVLEDRKEKLAVGMHQREQMVGVQRSSKQAV